MTDNWQIDQIPENDIQKAFETSNPNGLSYEVFKETYIRKTNELNFSQNIYGEAGNLNMSYAIEKDQPVNEFTHPLIQYVIANNITNIISNPFGVIDFGAGAGMELDMIKKYLLENYEIEAETFGIDISDLNVILAQSLGIEIRKQDATYCPENQKDSNSFALSNYVLRHLSIPNPSVAVNENLRIAIQQKDPEIEDMNSLFKKHPSLVAKAQHIQAIKDSLHRNGIGIMIYSIQNPEIDYRATTQGRNFVDLVRHLTEGKHIGQKILKGMQILAQQLKLDSSAIRFFKALNSSHGELLTRNHFNNPDDLAILKEVYNLQETGISIDNIFNMVLVRK